METEISPTTYQLIHNYFNLELGGKKVKTPYYINPKHKKGELRSLIGKGTPSEIIDEVKIWAKIKKFSLNDSSEIQIRKFMTEIGIGIDCSGLVSNLLYTELSERGINIKKVIRNDFGKDFLHKIYHQIRFLDNLDVETLSHKENSVKIENYEDIKTLDMLHLAALNSGFHIALVIKTCYNDKHEFEIHYIHSSRWYMPNDGVRIGCIKIQYPDRDLSHQHWIDNDSAGMNYIRQEYINNKSEGYFFRLKKLS